MALDSTAGSAPATRDIGAVEDEITALAAHLAAATYRLLALVREFDERDRQRHEQRELNWYIDDDCYVFKARLAPEQGAAVVRALDAAIDVSAETCLHWSRPTGSRALQLVRRR